MTSNDVIDSLLAPEGWAYASMPPVDPDDPGRFHALFGRDSLIFSLQLLPLRPDIAAATLRALATRQGRRVDAEIDEEPGKILHEYRPVAPSWLIEAGWPIRNCQLLYYGTADATAWFLVLLAATRDRRLVAELDHAWRAAAGWLERTLDRGDGLVWHGPRTDPGGLRHQGWRDSQDPAADRAGGGIVRWDGTAPQSPLADADSQAVAVAALRALTVLDAARARYWRGRLNATRARVQEAFTHEVMALEFGGKAVVGAGSQLGWLLWADALTGPAVAAAANRLLRPDVFTSFGLRTLASTHPQFRPHAYHRGAVWPFDSWLGWGGLRAAGYTEEAERVRTGVLSAIAELGRAPELYAVTLTGQLEQIPVSNRVQAWTVGASSALHTQWDGRVIDL
jgi:glycogen debranching enzyme